jgi:hypothetical protein
MPWSGAQQRAIAVQKMAEFKKRGMSEDAAQTALSAWFRAHGQGGPSKDKADGQRKLAARLKKR